MPEMLRRCRPLLGTYVEVTADKAEAIEAAFAAVGRIHSLMSAHDRDSDVSRINRFAHLGPIEVDAWTALVLERALSWSRRSAGVFDVVRAGKAAIASGYLPRHADQTQPEAAHWTWLEVQGRSVRLLKPACLDLGGIAKGSAVDQAVVAMRRAGASRGLVNAGGDLFGFGSEPWNTTVVDPATRQPVVEVAVRNEALATSACINGSSSHLPRYANWSSVTVRAPDASDADALTKIVWAGHANVGDLLARANATAFGIRADGAIEEVGKPAMAA